MQGLDGNNDICNPKGSVVVWHVFTIQLQVKGLDGELKLVRCIYPIWMAENSGYDTNKTLKKVLLGGEFKAISVKSIAVTLLTDIVVTGSLWKIYQGTFLICSCWGLCHNNKV